jgi:hypothetical protein
MGGEDDAACTKVCLFDGDVGRPVKYKDDCGAPIED